jgi:hypothetical protein
MGRRRKHDGDSGLASDQIPGQNQNNTRIRPCRYLLYPHQAFRGDTRNALYSTIGSKASEQ